MNRLLILLKKWKYPKGKMISRFIEKDIKREIIVVSIDNIELGMLSIKQRTYNVLLLGQGVVDKVPEYSEIQELEMSKLWDRPSSISSHYGFD